MNRLVGAPAAAECHVWQVPVGPRPGWWDLLSPEEHRRAERLARHGAAWDTFITSRAAQRIVLGGYLCRPAHTVRFDRTCLHCEGTHGRPRLPGVPLEFSVSHSGDWVLIAVVGTGAVGVDVERGLQREEIVRLAPTILAPAELERFATVPAERRARTALIAWTRKEAAMKLSGLGLRVPPALVDVRGATAQLRRDEPGWPAEPIWLRRLSVPSGHVAALATTAAITTVRTRHLPAIATVEHAAAS